jgi:hypothetical protein
VTQDEIIEMARQAGIVVTGEAIYTLCKLVAAKEREACADAALKAAESSIVLAMKIEREACAKVADGFIGGDVIAERIRARGQA